MFQHVGIVGGGHMGADIFGLLSAHVPVTLWVRREDAREALEAKLLGPLRRRAQRPGKKGEEAQARLKTLKITTDLKDLAGCDLISESIAEDPPIKRALFETLSGILSPDAVLTSNSSYTAPSLLASAYAHPEQMLGLHFFYPSKFVPFVEVIPQERGPEALTRRVLDFVEALGKRALLVRREVPGFLVNRAIGSFYTEAMHMAGEGYFKASTIDGLVKDRLAVVSPVEAADQIGLDVMLNGEVRFPDDKRKGDYISPLLHWTNAEGRYGQKVGKGVYLYEGGKPKDDPSIPAMFGPEGDPGPYSEQDLLDRIYYGEVQEAYRVLDLGVGTREDIAYCLDQIIGFKECPFKFTERVGKPAVLARLKALEETFGPRFRVTGSLAEV